MEKPLVSIIVPVYRVETYLPQCLESIISQTYEELDIILVDDGSPDNSGFICDQYALKDSRVRVIHQENGGPNRAVKAGLRIARGEYTCFVDSDDWVEPAMVEVLVDAMQKSNAGLVVANAVHEPAGTPVSMYTVAAGFYDHTAIRERIYPNLFEQSSVPAISLSPSRWAKLFRTKILRTNQKYYHEAFRRGEDILVTSIYVMNIDSLYLIPEIVYHYRSVEGSLSHQYNPKRFEEQISLISELRRICRELSDFDFSDQLDAMTISAVFKVIWEIRGALFQGKNKELKEQFRACIESPQIRRDAPYCPQGRGEAIKIRWIRKKRVKLLWITNYLLEWKARQGSKGVNR